jgi:glutathione peroxidase
MNTLLVSLCLVVLATSCSVTSNDTPAAPNPAPAPAAAPTGLFALSTNDIGGQTVALSQYSGQVVLVVNTASQCGYTPQYAGLEKLYGELKGRGFVVLGYPSNDFGKQEPGDEASIRAFCSDKYQVTFPMFSKVVTKAGPDQAPLYGFLGEATGKLPNWNFCKYLVGKDGKVLGFYTSKTTPDDAELRKAIETALAAG